MRFTVLDWNIGGAKVLEQPVRAERNQIRGRINSALKELINDRNMGREPDVIVLQEVVQWKEPTDDKLQDLLDPIEGYTYVPFTMIDTRQVSSKGKWNKVKRNSDWHPDTYFAQGNAFLVRDTAPHFPVWDLSKLGVSRPDGDHFIEIVHLDSGLYFGDRNTEPRGALVAHFICDPKTGTKSKPVDIFVVNVHITTLMMEREGIPEIDALAAQIRMDQLKVVFNGIVSRYNSWRTSGYLDRGEKRQTTADETTERHSPVWIIAGDFNFTEESLEYAYVKHMNFLDTVPPAGKRSQIENEHCVGTKAKGVGNPPTLTLDYVFAGPKFVALDAAIEQNLSGNKVIHDKEVRASDHYPIKSTITIYPS
jgi:endonuclease/exonuclease/phosphatase family metal-dependent hydrolase